MSEDLAPSDAKNGKPGRPAKENPRTEKLSCRLTKKEKANAEAYCKARGVAEAKLLRASYLVATAQATGSNIDETADAIMRVVISDEMAEPHEIHSRIKSILKNSVLFFALILFVYSSFSVGPSVARYFLHIYETGNFLNYDYNMSCQYRPEDSNGCEVRPYK